MPVINFPLSFDLNYYRNVYPELKFLPDDVIREHYKIFAVAQGHSTCPYDRREPLQKILQNLIAKNPLKVLEISPWDRPFLRGDNVKYFDIMDAESLQKTGKASGRNFNNVPAKIDFVSPNGDLNVIDETFDIVFSSHVIEHCPDFVRHLRSVHDILNKGGLYILIVPDKRYCFDYYHAESTISEVIDAFANKRKFPYLADVINQAYTITHNDAIKHWLGDHGKLYGYRNTPLEPDLNVRVIDEYFFDDGKGINREKFLQLIKKYIEARSKNQYISTHNWRFTPDSFGYIVNILNTLGFIDFPLYRLCHTVWGRQEFTVIIEKP